MKLGKFNFNFLFVNHNACFNRINTAFAYIPMASWTVEEKQIPEQHLLSIRLTTKEDQVSALVIYNIDYALYIAKLRYLT